MRYKLSDLFELQMGKTPSRNNPNYWNSNDYSWVSISDMSSYDKYVSGTKEYISERAVKESGIKTIPANTVIMSFKLSIGKTAITTGPIFSNEAIMAFIDKKTIAIDPQYIFYLFSGKDWDEGSNKAVMGKTLNKATLSNIEVDIPGLDIQKERIEKLNKISILISDKKQQLNQLDELIKARFVEMFGDKHTNDKGWEVEALGECATFSNGKAHEQVVDENGAYTLITSKAIASDLKDVRHTNSLLSPLNINDIAMVMSDVPNGRALAKCTLINENAKYTLNQRICSFSNYNFNPVFFYYILNRHPYFLAFNNGNSQTNLRKEDILKCKIIAPPVNLQNKFADFVARVDKSKFALSNKLAVCNFYIRLIHDRVMHGRINL